MQVRDLFPAVDSVIVFSDLTRRGIAGEYLPKSDTIILCETLKDSIPICANIVYLHEMFHSTGNRTRSLRRSRLIEHFDEDCYRVEECIAEICTMIAMKKLGWFTKTSKTIPEAGLIKYYDKDIYIPWREVVTCLYHYAGEGVTFVKESEEVKEYLMQEFKMRIQERYDTE